MYVTICITITIICIQITDTARLSQSLAIATLAAAGRAYKISESRSRLGLEFENSKHLTAAFDRSFSNCQCQANL